MTWLADKLGGVDKLFRLIAMTAGIAFAVFNFGKITSGLSAISKLLTSINVKTLAIIAVALLLALLVEDFINFMQGNDSLIGSLPVSYTHLAFADFLNSQYAIEWCHSHDVAISFDGDAQDLTGLVNDNNYEFRSRLPVLFYFTQKAVGYAAVLDESSIQYPTGEVDPDTGAPTYTEKEPEDTESSSGQFNGVGQKDVYKRQAKKTGGAAGEKGGEEET